MDSSLIIANFCLFFLFVRFLRATPEFRPMMTPVATYFTLILILETFSMIGYAVFVYWVTWLQFKNESSVKIANISDLVILYNLINITGMVCLNFFAIHYQLQQDNSVEIVEDTLEDSTTQTDDLDNRFSKRSLASGSLSFATKGDSLY